MKKIPLTNPKYASALIEVADMTFSLRQRPRSPYWAVSFSINGKPYKDLSTKETVKSKANKRAREMIWEKRLELEHKISESHTFDEARDRYIQLRNPHKNEIGYLNWISER